MSGFWEESTYYTGPPLTAAMVEQAETSLGYRLPIAYVEMLCDRNGGTPTRDCHPSPAFTSWAGDHVCIAGFKGVGGERGIDAPQFGSSALVEQYGLPPIGIVIGESPDLAYGVFMLDYRDCGPQGEPAVVHAESKRGEPVITPLAPSFATFVDGLRDAAHLGQSMPPVRWRDSTSTALPVAPALPAADPGALSTQVPLQADTPVGPKGLGGWLLLVGFGLIMAPYRLLRDLAQILAPLADPEIWSLLVTPGSELYAPALVAFLAFEILANLALVVLALVVAVKFLERSWRFPRLFIALLIAGPAIILVDLAAAAILIPEDSSDLPQSLFLLAAQMLASVVWIAYVKRSRRVKNTFVRGMP